MPFWGPRNSSRETQIIPTTSSLTSSRTRMEEPESAPPASVTPLVWVIRRPPPPQWTSLQSHPACLLCNNLQHLPADDGHRRPPSVVLALIRCCACQNPSD